MTAGIVEDAGAAGSTPEPGAIPFEHHQIDAALLADWADQPWSPSSLFSFAEAPLAFDLHDLPVISDGDDDLWSAQPAGADAGVVLEQLVVQPFWLTGGSESCRHRGESYLPLAVWQAGFLSRLKDQVHHLLDRGLDLIRREFLAQDYPQLSLKLSSGEVEVCGPPGRGPIQRPGTQIAGTPWR